MVKYKRSFVNEVSRFYLRAWGDPSCRSLSENSVRECLSRAQRASRVLNDYADLIMDNLRLIHFDKSNEEMKVFVLGITDRPGRRGRAWVYVHLLESLDSVRGAFAVLAVSNRGAEVLGKYIGRAIRIKVEEGAFLYVYPLNKIYSWRRRAKLSPLSTTAELPCVTAEVANLLRCRAILPHLLVEMPFISEERIAPTVGHIIAVKLDGKSVKYKDRGNYVQIDFLDVSSGLPTASWSLNKRYFSDRGGSCAVALISIKALGDVCEGYILSRLPCECVEPPKVYVPRNLYVEMDAERASEIVSKAPSKFLRYFEKPEHLPDAPTYRESLTKAYRQLGSRTVQVPNIKLLDEYQFEYVKLWLKMYKVYAHAKQSSDHVKEL